MSPSLNNEELRTLDEAFRAVCVELGLGANADDNQRREHLSQIIVSIANEGEPRPGRDCTTRVRVGESQRAIGVVRWTPI